jgi:hypothetical protein
LKWCHGGIWGKPTDAPQHPYTEYENTRLWHATKKALADLEQNQDLAISERHQYVIGYICKQLATKRLVTRDAIRSNPKKRRAG